MNNFIIIPDDVAKLKKKRGRPRQINSSPSSRLKGKVGRPRKASSPSRTINNKGTGSRTPAKNVDAEVDQALSQEQKFCPIKSQRTDDSEESSSSCNFKRGDQDQDVDLKQDEEEEEKSRKKPVNKNPRKRNRASKPSKFEIEIIGGTKFFKCPTEGCSKMATTSSNLVTHIRCVHEQEKRFKCETCAKLFSSSSSLQLHTVRFHSADGGQQLYVCKVPGCGRSI